ncbi:SAM-dependent methyltransferase [Sphingomonas sp.]|uniref:class I SAM-dependent methyltransferase n=1 Tax=Sphingomonas sp. TaxID=28214 RepID=UPI00286AA0BE|nr:SAM-dependent methyltransferase [Sphingomonas sp.]
MIRDQGLISVEQYMGLCNALYYATRDPLGAAGDFTTAPEISQMFGEIVGGVLADCWLRAGAPPNAAYVELGPGRGTLAADALRVLRHAGFAGAVHFVETSPLLRDAQRRRHPQADWHDSLVTIPAGQPLLLVANEFFDALSIRQWVGAKERRILFEGDRLEFDVNGAIREDSPARDAVAWEIGAQLDVRGGVALIIDYGHVKTGLGETLQAVRSHRYSDVLANPGEQDLTAHVDFEALAKAASIGSIKVTRVVCQGKWLERLGIGARAAALAEAHPERGQEIASERARLCDADAMGELFKVMAIHSANWPSPAGFDE